MFDIWIYRSELLPSIYFFLSINTYTYCESLVNNNAQYTRCHMSNISNKRFINWTVVKMIGFNSLPFPIITTIDLGPTILLNISCFMSNHLFTSFTFGCTSLLRDYVNMRTVRNVMCYVFEWLGFYAVSALFHPFHGEMCTVRYLNSIWLQQ